MCHDGQAADDQIFHLTLVERSYDGFNAGFFHIGTRLSGPDYMRPGHTAKSLGKQRWTGAAGILENSAVNVHNPIIRGHRYIDLDISPMTDSDLLRKFVDDRDEDAFAQIVDRHIDMVYAAANRQLAGSSHADDVTQAVFIVLAKKAAKVNGFTLAGWLVNAARLLAKQSILEEWRRKQREQQAAIMKAESYRPEEWQRVGPIVDEALSRLGQKDRTAVTLRVSGRPRSR